MGYMITEDESSLHWQIALREPTNLNTDVQEKYMAPWVLTKALSVLPANVTVTYVPSLENVAEKIDGACSTELRPTMENVEPLTKLASYILAAVPERVTAN